MENQSIVLKSVIIGSLRVKWVSVLTLKGLETAFLTLFLTGKEESLLLFKVHILIKIEFPAGRINKKNYPIIITKMSCTMRASKCIFAIALSFDRLYNYLR